MKRTYCLLLLINFIAITLIFSSCEKKQRSTRILKNGYYAAEMNTTDFTYSSRYAREYNFALLNFQDINKVDVVSGATYSYYSFINLVKAVIEQARTGNRQIVLVEPLLPDLLPGIPLDTPKTLAQP